MFLQNLRYGVRSLLRTPGFTVMAVAVLAIGIGANAAIFTLTNAFFLRPLPVASPDAVVRVYSNRYSNTRLTEYLEYRDRNSTLSGLAAFQLHSFGLRIDRDSEHAFGEIVSGNYFDVLGVTPARGRLLTVDDDRLGAPPVVVLAHAFWKRRFAGATDIVGKTIALNDRRFTVVGVATERFTGVMTPLVGDFWVPIAADGLLRPALDERTRLDSISVHMAGRLKPGVDRTGAQADLDTIGRQLRQAAGQTATRGPAVTVYGSTMLHPEISGPVTAFTGVLMAVVALVLLIVCVNVANLVLARAAGRSVELAIRQSLGAGRGRLICQLLTENVLISIAGAAGGLAIAFWCTRLVMAAPIPAPVPLALDLSLDLRVLAFTGFVAAAATVAFGIAPALAASRTDLVRAIKAAGPDGPRHSRLRSTFLVIQVSMSVLLLVTAGLFIRSFRYAQTIDPGFDASHVLTASIDLETRGYPASGGIEFIRALTERLDAQSDVAAANIVDIVPLTLSNTTTYLFKDGDPEPPRDQPTPMIYVNAVGPGHFKTLHIVMLAGRDFTYADVTDAQRVAIVNETLAQRFWPGKSAIGQRVRPIGTTADPREAIEVVGVVRDSKYVTVGEPPRPFLYRPLAQAYTPRITMLVRATGAPMSVLSTIRREVRSLDAGLPVFNVVTLAEATSTSLLPAKIAGLLLSTLGVVALSLAALGIYAVLSYLVRARTREIGIRVAIGARPGAVARMVVRQAMVWTVIGAAFGLALALVLTRFLGGFLYAISPSDPLTFGGVTLLLVLIACAAAAVPAVRASRLDPLAALRDL
jgi:predicted permease